MEGMMIQVRFCVACTTLFAIGNISGCEGRALRTAKNNKARTKDLEGNAAGVGNEGDRTRLFEVEQDVLLKELRGPNVQVRQVPVESHGTDICRCWASAFWTI